MREEFQADLSEVSRLLVTMAEAVRICLEVARGLACAWERAHLIHRDVKPGNIYLSLNGTVKLDEHMVDREVVAHLTRVVLRGGLRTRVAPQDREVILVDTLRNKGAGSGHRTALLRASYGTH